jgi:hypothetical protein
MLNDGMISDYELERKGLSYRFCPGTYLMELRKTMKHLSGYAPPEYESEILLPEQTWTVQLLLNWNKSSRCFTCQAMCITSSIISITY